MSQAEYSFWTAHSQCQSRMSLSRPCISRQDTVKRNHRRERSAFNRTSRLIRGQEKQRQRMIGTCSGAMPSDIRSNEDIVDESYKLSKLLANPFICTGVRPDSPSYSSRSIGSWGEDQISKAHSRHEIASQSSLCHMNIRTDATT